MAAPKFRVSDVAKKMGKTEKDLIFQLQSLGADVTDASQVLEPDVIQALITGKKLNTRTRNVIMREDKPLVEKKKEAVRPPRPIVQPPARKKVEKPAEEAPATPAPPPVIIPEFIQAAEAEEREAREAPAPEVQPKIEKPRPVPAIAAEQPAARVQAVPEWECADRALVPDFVPVERVVRWARRLRRRPSAVSSRDARKRMKVPRSARRKNQPGRV